MMSKRYRWRDSPNILAKLVDANNLNTWKTQEVVLKPNEACMFLVDGRIGDILTEKVVNNIAGGFSRFIGDMMGVTAKDRRLLFAMTGPADISIPFSGNLPNGATATGFANIRVQLRTEDIPKLLNMFANSAPMLDRKRLAEVLHNELMMRVINPSLAECSDDSVLRTSAFQEKFEMRAEVELRSTLSTLGFTMLKAFITTNQTDNEKIAQLQSQLSTATNTEGAHAEALMERIAIREAATLRRIECEVNVAKAEAAGKVAVELQSELKDLLKQEAYWEAELKRDEGQLNLRMKESTHKTEQAMAMFEQVQSNKRERIKQQMDHQNQRMDKQNDLQVKMMEMAAQNDALTPEVMQEFLRQQTAQKVVDGPGGELESASNKPEEYMCSSCSKPVMVGWNACPHCGISL
tara:strand:+ start:5030 stop:6250 length:1221 start_codon:yes stop_codon:yes gene_type:complete